MKVTCDRCHKIFDNMLKEQTKQINKETITKTYLECPNCKKQYVVCYDSKSTLALKKQIRIQTARLNTIRDENEYKRALRNIQKRKNRLERETRILQSKYWREFETKGEN